MLASLPIMVDLIVEDKLKCTLKDAVEKKWWESDETSPGRSRVVELCASSGKMKALKEFLTVRLLLNEKVIVIIDFPVVAKIIDLVSLSCRTWSPPKMLVSNMITVHQQAFRD